MGKFTNSVDMAARLMSFSGPRGPKGEQGEKGETGKSAYEIAVEAGFTGTPEEWLGSLTGERGPAGNEGGAATVYCWGDSLTQGIGGNVNGWHLISYPMVLSERVNTVNLGIMSDDVPTIQARQGSDPALLPAFTLPASSSEKVAIGSVDDGLPTRSGKRAKLLKYGDAGLNPCWIGDIKCYLSRDYKKDTTSGTTFYLRRAEDGEAVDVPEGTELTTFGAKVYRGNGIHIFWMGANGGYGTSANGLEFRGYLSRLRACVDFCGVDTYFIIYARERKGYTSDEAGEIEQLIEEFGEEHIILLVPALVERGLLYAETNVFDGRLVNGVPAVLDSGDGCHYSFYGYKAIGQIIWEYVAPILSRVVLVGGGSIGGGGTGGGTGGTEPAPKGDEFGEWVYKLSRPKTFAAGTAPMSIAFKPFAEPRSEFTIYVKYGADIAPETENKNAVLLWAEANEGDVHGRLSVYREPGQSSAALMCMLGKGGFRIDPTGFTLSEDGYHYLIISRSGDSWAVWMDGNWIYNNFLGYSIGDVTSDERLQLGTVNGAWKMTGTIADIRVYGTTFDNQTARALYAAMRDGE